MVILLRNIIYRLLFFLLLFFQICDVKGQNHNELITNLESAGFENIRLSEIENELFVSIENMVYRWDVNAVSKAIDICTGTKNNLKINLLLIRNGIPFLVIKVRDKKWQEFRQNKNQEAINNEIIVSRDIYSVWQVLRNEQVHNSNVGKTDVIFYPQFSYENTRLAKIYETQLNVAPLIDFSAWKGNTVSGQIIFPIHNELGYEGEKIRPGIVTLNQEFALPWFWRGRITFGNFTNSRYGTELYLFRPLWNENWNFEMKCAFTGSSHFLDYNWVKGKINTLTFSSVVSWYYPKFDLIFSGGAARYIYKDFGIFGTCTRHFGETSIGFFAEINQKSLNGGFMFNIPLPLSKRNNRKLIRLTIPNQFGLDYNAGTELYYNQKFQSVIDENQIKILSFTQMFKKELINFNL